MLAGRQAALRAAPKRGANVEIGRGPIAACLMGARGNQQHFNHAGHQRHASGVAKVTCFEWKVVRKVEGLVCVWGAGGGGGDLDVGKVIPIMF